MKKLLLSHSLRGKAEAISLCIILLIPYALFSQNVGIGTNTPQAKLDVNGNMKLQTGTAINKFSTDSLFTANSHLNVPTEKAIKDFLQKGYFAGYDPLAPGSEAPIPRDNQGFGNVYSIDVQGNYAYAVTFSGNVLQTFDISNPDQIIPLGFTNTAISTPTAVEVSGNYAYVVSSGFNSLCIYDISNPNTITFLNSTSTNLSNPQSVFIQGNYAYVGSISNSRLCIFDISNPMSIVAKGFTSTNISSPISVFAAGNYAYVVSYNNNNLSVYDISDPDAIISKGFISTNLSNPYSVVVQGNYAYVASSGNNMLCIFDISNPDILLAKGSTSTNLSNPRSLIVEGEYAYVASSNKIGIFKVSNPDMITALGFNSQYSFSGGSQVVKVQGDYLYTAAYGSQQIVIFDLDKEKTLEITSGGLQPGNIHWKSSGTNIYRQFGNVGINNTSPQASLSFSNTTEGKMDFFYVNASQRYGIGVQSGLLQLYTATSSDDVAFGFGSSAAFTERMRIKGNGNVGIGISNPLAPLQFSNDFGEKIILWKNSSTNYGLGIQGNTLQVHTDVSGADVVFGYGTSGSLTETMRIKGTGQLHVPSGLFYNKTTSSSGFEFRTDDNITRVMIKNNGNVGIDNVNPPVPLSFANTTGKKISLYRSNNSDIGFAVQTGFFQIFTDNPTTNMVFGYDQTGTFTERMRIDLNGNVGINSIAPGGKLEVRSTSSFPQLVVHQASISDYSRISLRNDNYATNTRGWDIAGYTDMGPITNDRLTFYLPGAGNVLNLAGNGSIGLGNSNPTTRLSFASAFEKKINLFTGGSGEVGMAVQAGYFQLYSDFSGGTVGIGYQQNSLISGGNPTGFQYNLDIFGNGNATLRGNLTQLSDARFKKGITPLQYSLEKVIQLNGYNYYWTNENTDHSLQTGLLAQEVQKLFPELVKENRDGFLSVNYSGLIPVMIESIKEQQHEIQAQQQQINELKLIVQKLVNRRDP